MNPLVHSIADACSLSRASRTAIYEAINSSELIAHKRGTRTVIFASDLQRWIESLPQIEPKQRKQERAAVSGISAPTKCGMADRKSHDNDAGKNRALSNAGARHGHT